MAKLDKVTIRGFKSIEKLENFELGSLNVLIGANGAGKSNFVEFFRLLRAMVEERLQEYMLKNAPADGYLHNGIKVTRSIEAEMVFGQNRYGFALEPAADGRLIINREVTQYLPSAYSNVISNGALESGLVKRKDDPGLLGRHGANWWVWRSVSSWQVYHFHDTSMTAGMRREVGVEQSTTLEPDASNLAAFLLNLRTINEPHYQVLRKTIQRIAPYFEDFDLRVTKGKAEDQVRLTWKQKGKQYAFSPGHFSDGTIRFICLATVLTQPSPPETIVLDEPELGLHPEALSVLGGLLRSASKRMQIIVATQSPVLLNEFEPDQIVTVDQVDGASRFRRLNVEELTSWLADYTVGELWQKGNIRGGVNDA
jgi:predicted ATPase